ncbi:peptidylprolyl isomerase [candidate division KSB1 bacterium]|nr:peptidylprolyl isomerase [candidate division KSB1 bacterium]
MQPAEGEIHAAHILIMYQGSERAPANITRTKEEAYATAVDLLQQLEEGADFAELATQYSDCPSAQKGGDLGIFGRGQMVPAFEEAAFGLQPGQVSEIIETPFGYHIILRK